MTTAHRVVVVGAGFSGIGMAARLRSMGIDDFVVLDRGHDLGGTWRDNAYPGAACDVPSNLYCYSFAPHPGSQSHIYGAPIQGRILKSRPKKKPQPTEQTPAPNPEPKKRIKRKAG